MQDMQDRQDMKDVLWAVTSDEPDPGSDPLPEGHVDVIIIGAGFQGLSAALKVAEAGKSAVVIEAGAVGQGASGRNGGQVQPGFGSGVEKIVAGVGGAQGEILRDMLNGTADRLFDIASAYEIACDPRQSGLIIGVHHPAALDAARKDAAARPDMEFWERGRVAEALGTDAYHGAIHDPRGGRC